MNGIVANEITEYRYHLNQNGSITLDEYMNAEMCYVVVPEEIDGYKVTEIAEGAFENRKNILGVLLPDTITRIAEKAFWGCSNLKKIRFGNNLSWIGAEAFAECSVLENLKIPSILDYLGEYAFSLCGIKRIEILGIKDWRPNSFALCTMLKSFSIKYCSMIPEGTFKHDIYLSEVTFENRVEKICETAFYDCRSFEQIIYDYWNYSINDDLVSEIEKASIKVDDLDAAFKKKIMYRKMVRCAKIIVGNYSILGDDEDMVTAGQLYSKFKEKEFSLEQIAAILPLDASAMMKEGKIPTIDVEDVNFELEENESLHYLENAILYIPDGAENSLFSKSYGTTYITGKRIVVQVGNNNYEVPFERLSKIVLYEALPEILEIVGNNYLLFIQTANAHQTYEFSKMLMATFEEIPEQPINMEKFTIDYFVCADLESYIFRLKTLSEYAIADDMRKSMYEMISYLEKMDVTLKKYPSYQYQSERFLSYYIPEVMGLMVSFLEYTKAGVVNQDGNSVYSKIMVAINKIAVAAKQQVIDIYNKAIVDTTARAEALAEILGQDGFVDSAYKING